MARKIIYKNGGLNNQPDSPNGYKFVGYDNDIFSEKDGSIISAIGGSGGGGCSIIPKMKVSYGKAFKDDLSNSTLGVPTTRTEDLEDNMGNTIQGNINLLIVDIKNWEEIKDFSPVLLLDRYRRKEKINKNKYRKAGYKHENEQTAIMNGRLNEVPLTDKRTIVDFIPENYFKLPEQFVVRAKGVSKNRSKSLFLYKDDAGNGAAFVPISLRIRLTKEGVVEETNQLLQMKLVARMYHSENRVDYDYTHHHI